MFDPNANPSAPGAPRALGSLPAGQPSAPPGPIAADEPVGGRGAPRDRRAARHLDAFGGAAAGEQRDHARPAGWRSAAAAAAQPELDRRACRLPVCLAVAEGCSYDLGYGYIQRKDLRRRRNRLSAISCSVIPATGSSPDAQYWLGESLFQRQRYRDAAESFLTVSTKHETSGKAPDSLLRLGQSLAALREKDAACATFGEIGRKYPRASLSVKQGVERERNVSAAEAARPVTAGRGEDLIRRSSDEPALILAVSGGPDSTALLVLAARWRAASSRVRG